MLQYRQIAVVFFMSMATGYGMPMIGELQAQQVIGSVRTNASTSAAILRDIRVTSSGVMLSVNANPQIQMQYEDNPNRLIVDLQNTSLEGRLHQTSIPLNRFGIQQVRVAQFQSNPAITRLVFDLDSRDPQSRNGWRSQYIAATNVLLLTPASPNRVAETIPTNVITDTVIERLSLSNTGQLLIEANNPINYQVSFDINSSSYNVRIANSKISANLQRPTLSASSPIERIRLSQNGSFVEINIKTIAGWQIRELSRPNNQAINFQVSVASIMPAVQSNGNAAQSPMVVPSTPNTNLPISSGERRRGVILIDPGHGGRDPGAIGNGIREKDVILPISLHIGQTLQSLGYTVHYSRTNDVEVDLAPRVALAERVRADVFVSVHANSLESRNSRVNGVETFYARGSRLGRELAGYVQAEIIAATGANNRGIKPAGFYVIARTSMPAILVETGFVTNPTEAANLSDPSYQKRMGEAIARGIEQFLRVRDR
jgi:N-acetylmuramoyl-L-alanine amidase